MPHLHPPGTPSESKSFPKWNEHLRVGIFLCHSPHHAASIPLLLLMQTGLVSPQLHCIFDNTFDTVKNEKQDTRIWPRKAHFQQQNEELANITKRDVLVT